MRHIQQAGHRSLYSLAKGQTSCPLTSNPSSLSSASNKSISCSPGAAAAAIFFSLAASAGTTPRLNSCSPSGAPSSAAVPSEARSWAARTLAFFLSSRRLRFSLRCLGVGIAAPAAESERSPAYEQEFSGRCQEDRCMKHNIHTTTCRRRVSGNTSATMRYITQLQ